jgi:hypothetical protein
MLGIGEIELLLVVLVVVIPVGIVLYALSLFRRFVIAQEKRTERPEKEKG